MGRNVKISAGFIIKRLPLIFTYKIIILMTCIRGNNRLRYIVFLVENILKGVDINPEYFISGLYKSKPG
jgi:hypothetical protein